MTEKRILVVDDEVDFVSMLVKNLELYGYEVEDCVTPNQVLNRFQKKTFDWALIDFKMPKMRGDKLIHKIQALGSSCKFIILTGYSVEDEIQLILDANPKVYGVMQKPLDLRKLVDVIERANNDQ